ncbi:hypothetical protein C2E31_17525 [Rhodopirellula baltica]|nr:hypothetical protein C2E31_17525 [Rhodopirellula baltica]
MKSMNASSSDDIAVNKTTDHSVTKENASTTFLVSAAELHEYARWSRDVNPLHVDVEAGRRSAFGGNICHGILVLSKMLSYLPCTVCVRGWMSNFAGQSTRIKRINWKSSKPRTAIAFAC